MTDKIAYVCDGNYHDTDDYGASAMALALVAQKSKQSDLVYFGWACHLGANDSTQHSEMETSCEDNLTAFGVSAGDVYDVWGLTNAADGLKDAIENATASDPLKILIAGPWESMIQAFEAAGTQYHEHCEIISHHWWNNDHAHSAGHRNKADFDAFYVGGGKWANVTAPGYTLITDQNCEGFWPGQLSDWDWMDGHTTDTGLDMTFVYDRTEASAVGTKGDMSDAGLMWYVLENDETPTMADIKTFFDY